MRSHIRYAVVLAFAAVVIASAAFAFSAQHHHDQGSKSTTVTVKGEVVDLWCFLSSGARGAGHKECAVTCAKAGNPVGLVDAKGHVYLLVPGQMHENNDSLIEKMADTITVTGKLEKKGGVEAIYVSSTS